MYVAITCCIMTCSISKGFVTYHGSMKCEINYNYGQISGHVQKGHQECLYVNHCGIS